MRRLACAIVALIGMSACGDDTRGGGKGGGGRDAGVDADPHIQKGDQIPDDPGVLSPPIVGEPLYGCAVAVTVQGFVPGAKIEVFVNGGSVASIVGEAPWGEKVTVPALIIGQKVTATQTLGPTTSLPSAEVEVRDYKLDFPAGPPRPYIDPTPLYECGGAIGGRHLVPGALFEIFSEKDIGGGAFDPPVKVGHEAGTGEAQWTYVNPPFVKGARIRIQGTMCTDKSPLSDPQIVQPEPPVPQPKMGDLYEGGKFGVVENVVNGAFIEVRDGASSVAKSWSPGGSQSVRIAPPAVAGHTLIPSQKLCGPAVDGPGVVVKPCSELPPAKIRIPSVGDTHVDVLFSVPGSRIRIYVGGKEIGDGGGPIVVLTRPLLLGETVVVVHQLGDCISTWIYVVEVACSSPELVADPSAIEAGDYRVGVDEYSLPAIKIDGDDPSVRLRGVVRYPADSDGDKVPLSARARPFPLVIVLHGNHGTVRTPNEDVCPGEGTGPEAESYRGYNYLLDALARGGFIAVSIDANDLNCLRDRIPERATLILEHLKVWQGIHGGSGPFGDRFKDSVDLARIGLSGHSRGGEAVVMAARDVDVPEFKILSVLSLAPVDTKSLALARQPLLMVLPAADGDVDYNGGAAIYDRATGGKTWFKSQMYIYGANHNYFNTEWLQDDINGQGPARLTRGEQEVMLRAWTRGWFDLTLKTQTEHLPLFSGEAIAPHLKNDAVFSSFQHGDALTVDDYEQFPADATKNTLNGGVSSTSFGQFKEHPFTQSSSAFNGSFFHATQGLVASWKDPKAAAASAVPAPNANASSFDFVSLRATTVLDPANTGTPPMSFKVGVEDTSGKRAYVPTAAVGQLPLAYAHPWLPKSMMRTLRFPYTCFHTADGKIDLGAVKALHLGFDNPASGVIGIDQMQLSK